jgi:hypothetical protein
VAAEHENDPGAIRAWITYDWANSAYATTILGAVLPAYFAGQVVGDEGVELFGRNWIGQDLWALAVGVGPLIMFLVTPVLGAIADFSAAKKRFLTVSQSGGRVTPPCSSSPGLATFSSPSACSCSPISASWEPTSSTTPTCPTSPATRPSTW